MIPMRHEFPTSSIGTVRHVLSRIIVNKNMTDNMRDKAIHVMLIISIGINHGSEFIVEEFWDNVLVVVFILRKKMKEWEKDNYIWALIDMNLLFFYWIYHAQAYLKDKK